MVQPLGVLSLNPLRSVVDALLATQAPISGLIDENRSLGSRENTADLEGNYRREHPESTVGFFVFGDLGFVLQGHSNLVQT